MDKGLQIKAFHGWAFDSRIWKPWREKLERLGNFQTYDRGYFRSSKPVEWENESSTTVLITHSFGLHFLDKSMLERADMLVIISGFLYFHPHAAQYRRRSRLILQEMMNQLEDNAMQVLEKFYKSSFAPESTPNISFENIDTPNLLKDLKLLKDSEFNVESLKKVKKVCILHGSDDKIVSNAKGRRIHRQLPGISKYFEVTNAGHALPYTRAEQCMEFIIPEINKLLKNKD